MAGCSLLQKRTSECACVVLFVVAVPDETTACGLVMPGSVLCENLQAWLYGFVGVLYAI